MAGGASTAIGGSIVLVSGSGGTVSGDVTIASNDAHKFANSGSVSISSGDSLGGSSGSISISTGDTTESNVGTVQLSAGSSTVGKGGDVRVSSGQSVDVGNGGDAVFGKIYSYFGALCDFIHFCRYFLPQTFFHFCNLSMKESGEGGSVSIQTLPSRQLSGSISLTSGSSAFDESGEVVIASGPSSDGNKSGDLKVSTGTSGSTGGTLQLISGNARDTSGVGGGIEIFAGNGVSADQYDGGNGGSVMIEAGAAEGEGVNDIGGSITIKGGNSIAASGGSVTVKSGYSKQEVSGKISISSSDGIGTGDVSISSGLASDQKSGAIHLGESFLRQIYSIYIIHFSPKQNRRVIERNQASGSASDAGSINLNVGSSHSDATAG